MSKITYAKLILKEKVSQHSFSSDIVAEVKLGFTENEIRANVQFQLHLFLYRVGQDDKPIHVKKEDATKDLTAGQVKDSHLLAYQKVVLSANRTTRVLKKILCPMHTGNPFLNGVKVLASLVPVKASESKWSNTYFFDVILK